MTTIKEFIVSLLEMSKNVPDGIETPIRIGHFEGEYNLCCGHVFKIHSDNILNLISSYYYYEIKTESAEENERFPTIKHVFDYVEDCNIKNFSVWKIENGVSDLLEVFENNKPTGSGLGILKKQL